MTVRGNCPYEANTCHTLQICPSLWQFTSRLSLVTCFVKQTPVTNAIPTSHDRTCRFVKQVEQDNALYRYQKKYSVTTWYQYWEVWRATFPWILMKYIPSHTSVLSKRYTEACSVVIMNYKSWTRGENGRGLKPSVCDKYQSDLLPHCWAPPLIKSGSSDSLWHHRSGWIKATPTLVNTW